MGDPAAVVVGVVVVVDVVRPVADVVVLEVVFVGPFGMMMAFVDLASVGIVEAGVEEGFAAVEQVVFVVVVAVVELVVLAFVEPVGKEVFVLVVPQLWDY